MEGRHLLAIEAKDTYPGAGKDTFVAAKEVLGSKVEYQSIDVHDLSPEVNGRFDLVLFMGVFYHLRNPLLALQKVVSVTKKLLICETHLLLPFVHERYPLVPFFRGNGYGPAPDSGYEIAPFRPSNVSGRCFRPLAPAAWP